MRGLTAAVGKPLGFVTRWTKKLPRRSRQFLAGVVDTTWYLYYH